MGQKFGQHIDESVELGGRLATEYTLLIYLTGGEESSTQGKASQEQLLGGETVFYNRRRVVAEVSFFKDKSVALPCLLMLPSRYLVFVTEVKFN